VKNRSRNWFYLRVGKVGLSEGRTVKEDGNTAYAPR
jgi:hypothetical protein